MSLKLQWKNVCCSLPVWQQIVLGLVLGLANNLFVILVNNNGIPLFLDEILIFTAALFGWWSAIFAMLGFHGIVSYLSFVFWWSGGLNFFSVESFRFFCDSMLTNNTYLYTICSITLVVLTRLYFKKTERLSAANLFFLGLLLALIISIEGGIIFSINFYLFHYNELNSLRYIELLLIRYHVPLPVAACISRIPINILDKEIAVFAGYFFAVLIRMGTDRLNVSRTDLSKAEEDKLLPR